MPASGVTFQLVEFSPLDRPQEPPRAGLWIEGLVWDAAPALDRPAGTVSMLDLLEQWDAAQAPLQRLAAGLPASSQPSWSIGELRLHPPAGRWGAVYCAGANYRDHIEEMARASGQPAESDPRSRGIAPWHFVKPSRSCVVGHGETVRRPQGSQRLDWEAELAVVIGRTAREVPVERALEHVAGYTIANDLSARDLSRRAPVDRGSPFHYDWLAHKGFDGSCPLGPGLTPAAQVPDPQSLAVRLWVNEVVKQDSSTAEMIYGVAEQIAHLSRSTTLHPGDVVLTGTPAGVGAARGEFLQPGDRVRIEIEHLGSLETRIA